MKVASIFRPRVYLNTSFSIRIMWFVLNIWYFGQLPYSAMKIAPCGNLSGMVSSLTKENLTSVWVCVRKRLFQRQKQEKMNLYIFILSLYVILFEFHHIYLLKTVHKFGQNLRNNYHYLAHKICSIPIFHRLDARTLVILLYCKFIGRNFYISLNFDMLSEDVGYHLMQNDKMLDPQVLIWGPRFFSYV